MVYRLMVGEPLLAKTKVDAAFFDFGKESGSGHGGLVTQGTHREASFGDGDGVDGDGKAGCSFHAGKAGLFALPIVDIDLKLHPMSVLSADSHATNNALV